MSSTARYVAAGVDGTIMVAGSVYVIFFSHNFLGPFEGFLITLGVPIAAWCGVILADIALRRRPYADAELYTGTGRYGDVGFTSVALVVVGTALGWGTVVNSSAGWLKWQGYLLGPLGLGGRTGTWEYANLGVLFALVLAFVGWLVLGRRTVRAQEATDGARRVDAGVAAGSR
jgi:NCS1 family nucleobase:cation symporter-1